MPIHSSRHRVLLAALLLRAGELVTLDELAEALWGDALPASPRKAIQTHVSRLRSVLSGTELIEWQPTGYVMRVDRGELDVGRFELLLEQATDAASKGDRHAEADGLREALALWRGEPLVDVPSDTLRRDADRLMEERLDALRRRIEVDLELGRHAELVPELRALTEKHPLREHHWALLMTALYRAGRQADALEAYQSVSRLLASDLGVDPGPELRALHQAILTNDPALAPPSPVVRGQAWTRPSQLPPDLADFVGRTDLVDQIGRLLGDDEAVPIVAVSGPPGVGKTALAVHAAHRLAASYPDGQLFVNLHGATTGLQPLAPLEVLGRFLRALGKEPAAVPADLEEASGLFRSRVAARRLLVVLDDAADATQVAPLLPAAPGCGVLVTSRRALPALDGARRLHLDVLPVGEAVELLGRLVGRERVAVDPDQAAEVARLCGRLPLALRIAGGRLAARPGWPVGALAQRLADTRRRLDELELAEVGVRSSFAVSYEQLRASDDPADRSAAEAFGLVGVLDGPEVGVPVVARLLDVTEETAERAMERLVDAHLLETPAPGRYRLHDLLRLYARELVCQHRPQSELDDALTRALGFYAASAWRALPLLRPGDYRLAHVDDRWRTGGLSFPDEPAALGWLEAERANLLAAIQQAAGTSSIRAEATIQLAQAMFGFFVVRGYWQDMAQANQKVLWLARRLGDRAAEAQAHSDLGVAYSRQGRYEEALACQRESLAIRRERGDRRAQAHSLGELGMVYNRQGRYQEALACQQETLAICRDLGDPYGEAHTLTNLGLVYERQGRYQEALACQRESLAIRRERGDRVGQAESLRELGTTLRELRRAEEARAHWLEALAIFEQLQTADADQVRDLLTELAPTSRR